MERMTLNPVICAAMSSLNNALEESTIRDGTIVVNTTELLPMCYAVLSRMGDPGFSDVTQCIRALVDILDGYDTGRQNAFEKAKADYYAICRAFGVRPTLEPGS